MNNFTFRQHYYEALKELETVDAAGAIEVAKAVCDYAFYGKEPEQMDGTALACFILIRAQIDAEAKVRDRKSPEYMEWRNAVFDRDNYTCQSCGERGGRLEAHHIRPWATYPELRYDIDNGRTLCQRCHRNIHKSGKP